jgi:hypothetical protein
MPDGVILHCDTARRQVIALNPDGTSQAREIVSTDGFTRGLCLLGDGRVAVGVQNEVLLFNPHCVTDIQRIRISEDPRESVHSIVAKEE